MRDSRPHADPQALHPDAMGALLDQVRVLSRKLTSDQMLEIADLLHEQIRERAFETRSWSRIARRVEKTSPRH